MHYRANAAFDETLNGYEVELEAFGDCFNTEDMREGATAFLEKRTRFLRVNKTFSKAHSNKWKIETGARRMSFDLYAVNFFKIPYDSLP